MAYTPEWVAYFDHMLYKCIVRTAKPPFKVAGIFAVSSLAKREFNYWYYPKVEAVRPYQKIPRSKRYCCFLQVKEFRIRPIIFLGWKVGTTLEARGPFCVLMGKEIPNILFLEVCRHTAFVECDFFMREYVKHLPEFLHDRFGIPLEVAQECVEKAKEWADKHAPERYFKMGR